MNGTSRRRLVSWLLIGLGIMLMLLGPSVMWSEQQRLLRLQPHVITPAPVLSTLLPLGGVVLFALGWLLVGAGVWCGRGLLVAAAAHMVIGAVWIWCSTSASARAPRAFCIPLHCWWLIRRHPGLRAPWSLFTGLAFYRAAAQMTQNELARHSGVARETVLRIERQQRRTSPCTINSLAAALATAPERAHGVSSRATNPRPYRDVFDPEVAADFS